MRIEGEAAATVWKIYYHFARDGSYSGAALVLEERGPRFQTLSGAWTLHDGLLDLGGEASIRLQSAPDHLRLESPGGVATLRRLAVE